MQLSVIKQKNISARSFILQTELKSAFKNINYLQFDLNKVREK